MAGERLQLVRSGVDERADITAAVVSVETVTAASAVAAASSSSYYGAVAHGCSRARRGEPPTL